jgi:U3 small nucleolar RNA-associated protein 20
MFFRFVGDKYYGTTYEDDPDGCLLPIQQILDRHSSSTEDKSSEEASDGGALVEAASVNTTLVQNKKGTIEELLHFLKLFALFTSPLGMTAHQELLRLYVRLLSNTDARVSEAALKCILRFKPPDLLPYADALSAMASDEKYRDTLATFSLEEEEGDGRVLPSHRSAVVPVVTRLLYGKLLQRRGKSNKDTLSNRRAVVLAYIASLRPLELRYLVALIMRPFDAAQGSTSAIANLGDVVGPSVGGVALEDLYSGHFDAAPASTADVKDLVSSLDLSRVSTSRKLGFLNLLCVMVSKLGGSLVPLLHRLLVVVLALLQDATSDASRVEENTTDEAEDVEEDNSDGDEEDVVAAAKAHSSKGELRSLCFKALADIWDRYPGYDYVPWTPLFVSSIAVVVTHLPASMAGASRPSALLLCIEVRSHLYS